MREEDQTRVNKMAQALFDNESSDLWKEVKRSRGTRKLQTTVQTAISPQEIVSLFKDHFASLYTSVDGSASGIADFARDGSAQCTRDDWVLFSKEEIMHTVHQLQLDKGDSDYLLCSSALKFAPRDLYTHMARLINDIAVTGYFPSMLKENTIILILKRSTLDPSCMDNYRAISLSSLFGKVIDHLFLRRCMDFFSTKENRYAFKKNGSCNKCTFVLIEVINCYVSNGFSPIACFLEMHKAFDRVNLTTLFAKLPDREVPPHVLRLLLGLYTQQKARVLWNGVYSEHFPISNGVKQGGVFHQSCSVCTLTRYLKYLNDEISVALLKNTFLA